VPAQAAQPDIGGGRAPKGHLMLPEVAAEGKVKSRACHCHFKLRLRFQISKLVVIEGEK